MNSPGPTTAEVALLSTREVSITKPIGRPSFRIADIWKAPLHDLPIRDEILYQYLPLSTSMKVMESGPGSGFTSFRLARHVRQLMLVEVSAQNARRLNLTFEGIGNVQCVCADVCAPGLTQVTGDRYDVIYALEMFEYAQDPETCLKNFGDALRPDGILMLEFPNYPPERSPGIAFFRKRKELETLLRAANFRSWEINALRLRPWTGLLFKLFHEQPLQVYRLWRDRRTSGKPMIYEQTWAFQNKDRLTPSKIVLHLAWSILFAWMRLGGDCFERIPLGDEIENYDLLVIGRR